ncbi:AAA family ATPase [Vibrio parahaemolyticus]|uniref:AAA family ATPase n=1 Tax=Vibrio parahaemolyticus TaxID=670 RepID=UPI000C8696AD|nr:AAA family ATPase [Vibrio parahaemolyticus]PMS49941.1 DNA transposition protein [Vibrio parahaemolyticus]PMS55012.1 DNA transposition protein [Vibrio parahaemolyticus]PMS60341.1 DNA transposition protein [Vibrio parahaemolyticus]PMS90429.1 DNA transposition protein [Vibrio parahaemolyticus]PMS94185.1 DNA transposition protein [Vibrio parahaemolyticus]
MTNVVEIGKQEAQQTDVLMRVRALTESKVVSASQIAKEISVSPATLSQILNGSYKADPSKMIQKLERWLNYREEKNAKPSVNPGFVMTQTAQLITNDLTYAQVTESISVIYGASGVGKSETLREYQKNNNNVWMITASPSRSSLTECLYELALELGLDDAPRRKGMLARVIRNRLIGSEGLVIIDEADHLDYPTLEELRILQEETGIGMVLVGNNKVYTQLTGGRRNEDFARLFSRIAKKRGIHKTKQADVRAIADAWNVNGATERSLMQQISERPGGLRILSKTLKLATMFANGQSITEQVLRKAFAELETNE